MTISSLPLKMNQKSTHAHSSTAKALSDGSNTNEPNRTCWESTCSSSHRNSVVLRKTHDKASQKLTGIPQLGVASNIFNGTHIPTYSRHEGAKE